MNPRALAQLDEGPADPAMNLNYVTLTFKTSPSQQADLDQLLKDQQDPFSPHFRQWLTPDEYADRFGVSTADLAKVTAWLQSEGFELIAPARGRRWIAFNATVQQIQTGFRTEIHKYRVDGELHFANSTEPSVPEAIQSLVLGVDGLHDFRERHMAVPRLPIPSAPPAHALQATSNGNGGHQLVPGDVWNLYDIAPILRAGITGAGQKIAIIDRSDVQLSDISQFRNTFGLPNVVPQRVLVAGATNPGITSDNAETDLDLDWAGAIAPDAQLVYVFAPSEYTAVSYAIDQNLAPVISYSYYPCELNASATVAGNVQALAQQANAQGQTWMACSGDSGAESCDSNNYSAVAGTHGVAISLMNGVPEITGVGGTTFNEGVANESNGKYWNVFTGNLLAATAVGYIPEVAWTGSGGGYSVFYLKPDWQIGVPGTPGVSARGAPDVSFSSDPNHDGYIIFDNGKQENIGGTSIATPVFAGIVTLLNQYLGTNGLGNVNPNLYRLAQSVPSVFHDITSGNNFHLCKQGTPNCAAPLTSVGYTAIPGWDAVTGLGSVDAYNLLKSWGNGQVGTNTSVTASPTSLVLSGQTALLVTVRSAGSSITPTGTVSANFNNATVGSASLSGSGSTATATITIYGSQLPAGNDTIYVTYGGDKNVNGSSASVTVNVTVPVAASAVIPLINPNPVFEETPDADGYGWFYTIRLTEVAGSATTLTGFSINGTDYSSSIAGFFGTSSLPANGALSASLKSTGLIVPLQRAFSFSGRDANGRTWTQQISVQFLGPQLGAAMQLVGLPGTIRRDPTQDPSCQYFQNLGLQEQNGHSVTLTRFLAAGGDYSDQIAYLFGSSSLPAFGSLLAGICWDLTGDTIPETLNYEMDGIDDTGAPVSATVSSLFVGAATNPGILSTSSDSNNDVATLSVSDSSKSTTASVAVKVNSGQPWAVSVFPANRTTSWLTVYPLSGTGPATVNISAAGAGLEDGLHQATLVFQSVDALPESIAVSVNLVVGQPKIASVVNGATLTNTGISPGLIFTLFGSGLGPDAGQTLQLDESGKVETELSGVQVLVNGTPAPILYLSQGQINAVAPYEIAGSVGRSVNVQVFNNNVKSTVGVANVVAAAPAIFSLGNGQGAILNQDGSVNGPGNPAAKGSYIQIYGTGEGQLNPSGIDGRIATDPLQSLPRPASPFSLTIGGVSAVYTYAGTAPQSFEGFFQVDAMVPLNAGSGSLPVVLKVGAASSPPVNVTVK
ncbi:MAG TPA: protease pro-enzyme activation domain-containing protein [Bryobacteraceae bacterium]|jgi:uncharacterized protein (TIGR03437 family)